MQWWSGPAGWKGSFTGPRLGPSSPILVYQHPPGSRVRMHHAQCRLVPWPSTSSLCRRMTLREQTLRTWFPSQGIECRAQWRLSACTGAASDACTCTLLQYCKHKVHGRICTSFYFPTHQEAVNDGGGAELSLYIFLIVLTAQPRYPLTRCQPYPTRYQHRVFSYCSSLYDYVALQGSLTDRGRCKADYGPTTAPKIIDHPLALAAVHDPLPGSPYVYIVVAWMRWQF